MNVFDSDDDGSAGGGPGLDDTMLTAESFGMSIVGDVSQLNESMALEDNNDESFMIDNDNHSHHGSFNDGDYNNNNDGGIIINNSTATNARRVTMIALAASRTVPLLTDGGNNPSQQQQQQQQQQSTAVPQDHHHNITVVASTATAASSVLGGDEDDTSNIDEVWLLSFFCADPSKWDAIILRSANKVVESCNQPRCKVGNLSMYHEDNRSMYHEDSRRLLTESFGTGSSENFVTLAQNKLEILFDYTRVIQRRITSASLQRAYDAAKTKNTAVGDDDSLLLVSSNTDTVKSSSHAMGASSSDSFTDRLFDNSAVSLKDSGGHNVPSFVNFEGNHSPPCSDKKPPAKPKQAPSASHNTGMATGMATGTATTGTATGTAASNTATETSFLPRLLPEIAKRGRAKNDHARLPRVTLKPGETFNANIHCPGLRLWLEACRRDTPVQEGYQQCAYGGASVDGERRLGLHLAPSSSDIFADGIHQRIVGWVKCVIVTVQFQEGATNQDASKGESSWVTKSMKNTIQGMGITLWNVNKPGANTKITSSGSVDYYAISFLAMVKNPFPYRGSDRQRCIGTVLSTIVAVCGQCWCRRLVPTKHLTADGSDIDHTKRFRFQCTDGYSLEGEMSYNCGSHELWKKYDPAEPPSPKLGYGTHTFVSNPIKDGNGESVKITCMFKDGNFRCKKTSKVWCEDEQCQVRREFRSFNNVATIGTFYCKIHRAFHYMQMKNQDASRALCQPCAPSATQQNSG